VYKISEDTVDSKCLLEELDINPELPTHQIRRIQEVIINNQQVFGLDDRLGHLDTKIQIPLKPGFTSGNRRGAGMTGRSL
jgi:hypothetical protein